jgi:predicted Zn-dependent protease
VTSDLVRWLRRGVMALACAVAATACGDPMSNADVPAYDPTYRAGNRDVLYHWDAGRTIHVYAQPTRLSISTDLPSALRTGFAAWARVPEFREYHFALVDRPEEADVIVRLRDDPPLVSFLDCAYPTSSASGITFFCPDASLHIVQVLPLNAGGGGQVRMDVAVAPPGQSANFPVVVTHELGHVLGIGAHSAERTDLMYPFPTVPVPSARDIATLRYVLHQPSALIL